MHQQFQTRHGGYAGLTTGQKWWLVLFQISADGLGSKASHRFADDSWSYFTICEADKTLTMFAGMQPSATDGQKAEFNNTVGGGWTHGQMGDLLSCRSLYVNREENFQISCQEIQSYLSEKAKEAGQTSLVYSSG